MNGGDPWLDDEEQRVWRQWLHVTGRLPTALNRQLLESSDLSLSDFDVLVQLSEHPEGRLRVSVLAERLQWERSRLSHHVSRMQRRLLVVREECHDDGRGWWVVLTDEGRRCIEAAAPGHACYVRQLFFDDLAAADLAALDAITRRIAERLEAAAP